MARSDLSLLRARQILTEEELNESVEETPMKACALSAFEFTKALFTVCNFHRHFDVIRIGSSQSFAYESYIEAFDKSAS